MPAAAAPNHAAAPARADAASAAETAGDPAASPGVAPPPPLPAPPPFSGAAVIETEKAPGACWKMVAVTVTATPTGSAPLTEASRGAAPAPPHPPSPSPPPPPPSAATSCGFCSLAVLAADAEAGLPRDQEGRLPDLLHIVFGLSKDFVSHCHACYSCYCYHHNCHCHRCGCGGSPAITATAPAATAPTASTTTAPALLLQVQDFTQAELHLDLRVVSDPNSIFYCGDTAQTIARGVGFRWDC